MFFALFFDALLNQCLNPLLLLVVVLLQSFHYITGHVGRVTLEHLLTLDIYLGLETHLLILLSLPSLDNLLHSVFLLLHNAVYPFVKRFLVILLSFEHDAGSIVFQLFCYFSHILVSQLFLVEYLLLALIEQSLLNSVIFSFVVSLGYVFTSLVDSRLKGA